MGPEANKLPAQLKKRENVKRLLGGQQTEILLGCILDGELLGCSDGEVDGDTAGQRTGQGVSRWGFDSPPPPFVMGGGTRPPGGAQTLFAFFFCVDLGKVTGLHFFVSFCIFFLAIWNLSRKILAF